MTKAIGNVNYDFIVWACQHKPTGNCGTNVCQLHSYEFISYFKVMFLLKFYLRKFFQLQTILCVLPQHVTLGIIVFSSDGSQ